MGSRHGGRLARPPDFVHPRMVSSSQSPARDPAGRSRGTHAQRFERGSGFNFVLAEGRVFSTQINSRVEESRGIASAARFPSPAHQTGRADFPHPAFRLVSRQAHGRAPFRLKCRGPGIPGSPETASIVNGPVPREGILRRRTRKFRARSYKWASTARSVTWRVPGLKRPRHPRDKRLRPPRASSHGPSPPGIRIAPGLSFRRRTLLPDGLAPVNLRPVRRKTCGPDCDPGSRTGPSVRRAAGFPSGSGSAQGASSRGPSTPAPRPRDRG